MSAAAVARSAGARRTLLVALVFCVAFNLRAVILAVPPVLPMIRSDLGLSYTASGAITSLPLFCFALGSIPGAILANRFGARRLIAASMIGLVVGALLRLAPPQRVWIFIGTIVLSLAVALAQPAIPFLIRTWFRHDVERVLSVYVLAISLGGLIGASATLSLTHFGGWRGTFLIWSVPAVLAAVFWLRAAPAGTAGDAVPSRFASLLRDRGLWRMAVLYGAQNFIFFSVVSWLPFLLRDFSVHYVELTLFLINVVVIPPFIGLSVIRSSYATSPRFYAAGGALATAGVAALALGLAPWAWLLVLLIGFGTGLVAIGAMTVPAMLARSDRDVAAYAAIVLTIGQLLGFSGPLLGGILIDQLHVLTAPFWPPIAAGIVIVAISATTRGTMRPRLDPL